MLVAAFQVHIGGSAEFRALFQHRPVADARLEPDVHDVWALC